MTLQELIDRLSKEDPKAVLRRGFNKPHSYRGDYACLAFTPCESVSVEAMLITAKGAVDRHFVGYKGGEYLMWPDTEVYLAHYGDTGDELSSILLDYMLANKVPETVAVRTLDDAMRQAVKNQVDIMHADQRRLDWLWFNLEDGFRRVAKITYLSTSGGNIWLLKIDKKIYSADTMRGAIDNAMQDNPVGAGSAMIDDRDIAMPGDRTLDSLDD
jgi:hypothetical protein